MAHPIHEILMRFLGSEQFAFDAGAREIWPWERYVPSAQDRGNSGDDAEPMLFDDVYPWLEPES